MCVHTELEHKFTLDRKYKSREETLSPYFWILLHTTDFTQKWSKLKTEADYHQTVKLVD